ncbi:MAG TPA: MFS transporter [Puia sp.]|nr:MFS transporter [Puia sp.]
MSYGKAAPVFLGFFIMGFVDVVGISTNYAKVDYGLKDSMANLLPMMVFIWFALFSLPTSLMMNRIGRRKTVLAGMGITCIALTIPYFIRGFPTLLACFTGIGIGNTILQVALNPLLANVVPVRRLTPALTGGQLIKALASFLGPLVAGLAAAQAGNWRLIFPLFGCITLLNGSWLWATRITELPSEGPSSTWMDCLALFKKPAITGLFIGVVCIVGLDVGLNTTIPKFLMQRCGLPLDKAGLGTSLYFIARTAGSLFGVFLLARTKGPAVFLVSTAAGIAGILGLLLQSNLPGLCISIVVLGLAVANIFPILFSTALQKAPGKENEVSGLLIMGVSGGALLLPIMGLLADGMGQAGAIGFLLLAWGYLGGLGVRMGRMG